RSWQALERRGQSWRDEKVQWPVPAPRVFAANRAERVARRLHLCPSVREMAVRSGALLILLSAGCLGPVPQEAGGGAVTRSVTEPRRTWVGRITQGGRSCSGSLIEPRIV